MKAFLDIHGLCVDYGANRVLHGIDLTVEQGEFIALLGSSGCGKTTLLRAVAGFQPVALGSIRVKERDVTRLPPEKRDMAMVFQSYALWPHMTVGQNIGYGLKLRGKSAAERRQRITEILSMLNLGGLEDRPVTQLSGGQRQRVALGRALAVDPSTLLLDEPLSNLDARIRLQVRHEIKALQRRLGITTLLVTHDREEAMVMADRIVILDQGRVAQMGTPEDIYDRPGSPFVAAFMGAENVLHLRTEAEDGRPVIAAGPFSEQAPLPPGADLPKGPVVAHFRNGSVRLHRPDEAAPAQSLMLRGRITQTSYPGGHYRYAVAVGDREIMVDDEARLEAGLDVRLSIPVQALHLYPEKRERGEHCNA
ncbi:ABC transporter ATP-binding protein [Telmatospirillum sp. J64-1]|uniref:ABC transporter ATP-binding protein n=1 Tax=Telmatospirillum sp. J64-1 TaxID=2502183 RepID=UPI00115E2528|nr:ABC transporter ATP-binding protein [Telmatospirillum sp. J64-1]